MTAAILLLHRYMAVAAGVIMTLWCLSGFVMMYQAYPELTAAERLQGLPVLDLSACCGDERLFGEADLPMPAFTIEMLGSDPVVRLGSGRRPRAGSGSEISVLNLRTGEPLRNLPRDKIAEVAARFARGHNLEHGAAPSVTPLDIDQWTVQTAARNRPAYRVAFHDGAGTEIYVSGATGEVFQDTNRTERVLTWLGAIPHWLYPLQLRQNGALWTEIVIWSAVVGTFLTATGLYLGISRYLRASARGRTSPFRGWWYWHHVSGLGFGVLTLTWVFSGLLTMNPWNTLSGNSASNPGRSISGTATWGEFRDFLAAASSRLTPDEFVQLQSAPFDGELFVMATRRDGSSLRLDTKALTAELMPSAVESAVASLDLPIASFEILEREDSYYYGHKQTAELPVYRIVLGDPDSTHLYVDYETGSVRTVDATRRVSRWIRTGLHDLDFALIRQRPIWDITVITMLIGVTFVCFTGTWMALKRIRLDWRLARRRLRVRRRLQAAGAS